LLFAFVEAALARAALVRAALIDTALVDAGLDALLAFPVRDFVMLVVRPEADLRRVEEEREAMKFNPSDVFRRKVGFFVTASQDGTKKRHPDDKS
jgi:hypothetical protein